MKLMKTYENHCLLTYCIEYCSLSFVAGLLLEGNKSDLRSQSSPSELLEVSGSIASLEGTGNSAGRQQSQPISISAAGAWAEYKAVDQREKRMRQTWIFHLCGGEKFDSSPPQV